MAFFFIFAALLFFANQVILNQITIIEITTLIHE